MSTMRIPEFKKTSLNSKRKLRKQKNKDATKKLSEKKLVDESFVCSRERGLLARLDNIES